MRRFLVVAALVGLPMSSRLHAQTSDSAPAPPTIDLYGFIFGQFVFETRQTGRDRFLNIQPLPGASGVDDDSPDAFFDVSATRVGFDVRAGDGDVPVHGNLEIDFDTPTLAPRIRHAFGEVGVKGWGFLAGKTWSIVSQLNPATIDSDNLFNLGNTYERVPQARVSYRASSRSGVFEVQVGAATFFGVFDQAGLAMQTNPAAPEPMSLASNTPPVVQGRVAYGWEVRGGSARLALGASAGRVKARSAAGVTDGTTHLLVTGEILAPITPAVEVMVEGFYGVAPGFNGGVGQTAVVTATGDLQGIRSWGGFTQLKVRPSGAVTLHAVGGIDDPETRPGDTPLEIGRNWTALANLF
jgi:hypothetical protein